MVHKVIIMGSGCAGSTAAIYAARANLAPMVLEGHEPGGQLSLTTDVENFPGFPEGIQGPELVASMKRQAERFGAEFRMEGVTEVGLSSRPFKMKTHKETYECESLIIATGASARLLGLENESKLLGHGVSTCATCDGAFFRDQEVMVVGGGDSAMEEALFLTKFASKVHIAHRRDEFRASKIMSDRVLAHDKIEVLWNTVPVDVYDVEKNTVNGVRLKDTKTNEERDMKIDGFFVAIGHIPNTKVFQGKLDMTPTGYLTVGKGSRTNIEGVFAAGDVHDHVYRQAITAAGAGCQAAIDCERWLEDQAHQ